MWLLLLIKHTDYHLIKVNESKIQCLLLFMMKMTLAVEFLTDIVTGVILAQVTTFNIV